MEVRELYWNIDGDYLLYVFMIIAMGVFAYGVYQKWNFWKIGREEDRFDRMGERLKVVLVNALGHKKILRDGFPGLMHAMIFYGFAILFIGTLLVMLQKYLGIQIMQTQFFLGYSLLMDLFGLLAIIGVLMALYRRYIVKPDRLDNKPDDLWGLLLILAVLVTGFGIEGARLAANPVDWIAWTPVGMVVAGMLGGMMGTEALLSLHKTLWWTHMILAFGFIAYLPYSKLLHIITSTANQYFTNLENDRTLTPIDFEDEELEAYGVSKVEDFTWKQLYDSEACTRCGRCQDNCPAHLTGKPLTPKGLVQDIGEHLKEKAPFITPASTEQEGEGAEEEVAATAEGAEVLEKEMIGDVIDKDVISSCTTCRSCMEQCPVMVEHLPKIFDMRRYLVLEEGEVSAEAQRALSNIEKLGNPWGMGKATRGDWAKDLGVKTLDENPDSDILYWVGCAGSFDARNQKISEAFTKIMQEAGVNFSIMGAEETCCGDSPRRLGNEYLYQMLAETNVEVMNEYGVKKIVTACPHCFNTLKNDYPQLGGNFEVVHHSEFIKELIDQGKITMKNSMDKAITYHDSCYLGRYNNVYQQPRQIIQAIPGTKLNEMERNLERGFCCGAGGGRMWEEETIGDRINEVRTDQALETKPDVIVTGCPFCLTMIDDGTKSKGVSEEVKVLDVAEIVRTAMEAK
ncbi:Fe-S oxidoreductase/nitrate reductase gamma subunit [Desulfitispora alkaliphila]|uniref:heterodisulfide reductase-related iron-sulfur binding cluster n=1 Tax=Desulfitispora alkaliphila TaxID=622674 RepID=UPI003D1F6C1B